MLNKSLARKILLLLKLSLVLFLFLPVFSYALTWPAHWKAEFYGYEFFTPNITPPYSGADGNEDNWGIAFINSIYNLDISGNVPWWSDSYHDNYSIRVFFYGLDLSYWNEEDLTYGMTSVSDGAYLEIYEWNEDYNEDSLVNASNRPANSNTFNGITNGGTLLAKFEFTYGVTSDQDIVVAGKTADGSNPPSGSGSAFLKIVGGLYYEKWNINKEKLLSILGSDLTDKINSDLVDPEADMYLTFSFYNLDKNGFVLRTDGSAFGATIPEPATVVLVGTGLLIIGTIIRKRS